MCRVDDERGRNSPSTQQPVRHRSDISASLPGAEPFESVQPTLVMKDGYFSDDPSLNPMNALRVGDDTCKPPVTDDWTTVSGQR
jgi:hypothetical protein